MASEKKQTTTATQVASVVSVPGYEIKDVLGKGGCAVVYLAIQQSIGREVALKVLAPDHTDDTFTDRFLREAKIVSQLTHPNIITIFDAGVHQGIHYMAMEYVPGKTFSECRDRLSRKQRLHIIKQIATALDFAGGKGFVHRDIKPENVLLHDDGRAILTDFGIARSNDVTRGLTQTGKVLGTPYFMSPEQTKGLQVDHRSDIYGLGIMLFQSLTGLVPFDGPSLVAIGIKHLSEPVPTLPKGLEIFQPIVNKSMSKNPEHRYQTAGEFRLALEAISDDELDYIDAKVKAFHDKAVNNQAETLVDKSVSNSAAQKISIPDDVKPQSARSRTSTNPQLTKATAILASQDYQAMKLRRRRLLSLIFFLGLAAAAFYYKAFLIDYWHTQAVPLVDNLLQQQETNTTANTPPPVPQDPALENIAPQSTTQQNNPTPTTATPPVPAANNSALNAIPVQDLQSRIDELHASLNEKPGNVSELIKHYKQRIGNDPDDRDAQEQLKKLRQWFASEFKQAINTDDIDRAKKLSSLLSDNFPNITSKVIYQRMQARIAQAEKIQPYLAKARVYFAANALAEPAGANAMEELHKVLRIRADHPGALQGLAKIYQSYLSRVKQQQQDGEYYKALKTISLGLKSAQDKSEMLAIQSDIKRRLKTNSQSKNLVKQARAQVEAGKLLTPANDNAYHTYNKVLAIDANNADAKRGMQSIEKKLIYQTNIAIKKNDYTRADKLLKQAEQYFQTNPEVIKARRALDTKLKEIVPLIPTLRVSNSKITNLISAQTAINKIKPGQKFYVGFDFKNFTSSSHILNANLLDGTGTRLLSQQAIIITGPKGEHYFSMNLPIPGASDGNYIFEIKLKDTRLIKVNLFGLH